MLESARRDLLLSKRWARSKHPLRKGPFWLFYRYRDWGREGKQQWVAEPGKNSDLQIPPPSPPQDYSFKSPFNSKEPGETNCCFAKACVISDQTLQRLHLTDILISKMSKHVKDHEVKIKSQVSWRKLSGLKNDRKKEREKNKTTLLSSGVAVSNALASMTRSRQPPCRGLCWLSCSLQSIRWRNSAVTGPASVCRGCWDGESPWNEIYILGKLEWGCGTR